METPPITTRPWERAGCPGQGLAGVEACGQAPPSRADLSWPLRHRGPLEPPAPEGPTLAHLWHLTTWLQVLPPHSSTSREPAWPLLPLGSSPGPALSPKVLTHTMPPARWFIRSGSREVLRPEHVPVDPSPADAVFPVAGAVVRVPRSGPGARGLGGPRCAQQGTTGLGAPVLASPGDPVALPRAFPSPHGP